MLKLHDRSNYFFWILTIKSFFTFNKFFKCDLSLNNVFSLKIHISNLLIKAFKKWVINIIIQSFRVLFNVFFKCCDARFFITFLKLTHREEHFWPVDVLLTFQHSIFILYHIHFFNFFFKLIWIAASFIFAVKLSLKFLKHCL